MTYILVLYLNLYLYLLRLYYYYYYYCTTVLLWRQSSSFWLLQLLLYCLEVITFAYGFCCNLHAPPLPYTESDISSVQVPKVCTVILWALQRFVRRQNGYINLQDFMIRVLHSSSIINQSILLDSNLRI